MARREAELRPARHARRLPLGRIPLRYHQRSGRHEHHRRHGPPCDRVIKYIGSKRRLVPALRAIAETIAARDVLDLFTGTTRVAQAFRAAGARVTAVDRARYAEMFART